MPQDSAIPGSRAWALAIETLTLLERRRLNSTLALSIASRTRKGLSGADLKAAKRLVVETIRRRNFIDKLLNTLLEPETLGDLERRVRAFARLFVFYTRLDGGNSEARAIELAKIGRRILGWRSLHPIERILGMIIAFDVERLYEGVDEYEALALKTFHPAWFVRYCFRFLGEEESLRLLESGTMIPPTYLRVNTLRRSLQESRRLLEEEGVVLSLFTGLKNVYEVIGSSPSPVLTEAYRQGLFYLQDPASCLAVEAAHPQPGWRVLDVCAAPGGKTSYLAQLMGNRGRIVSVDLSGRRINILKREIRRGGATIVDGMRGDAFRPLPLRGRFELVVLDPPCSGSGVFWRLPSTKWRLSPRSFGRYKEIQSHMIDSSSEKVELEGFLIYSTCSISLEENEQVVEEFLERHSGFRLVDARPRVGEPGFGGMKECQRLYPHRHRTNGFFLAKMQRIR